jgi:hypothetical protein
VSARRAPDSAIRSEHCLSAGSPIDLGACITTASLRATLESAWRIGSRWIFGVSAGAGRTLRSRATRQKAI